MIDIKNDLYKGEDDQMLQKVREALRRFLSGRYGMDELGVALLIIGFLLMLAARFWMAILLIPAYAALGYEIYRSYSRNIAARRRENAWFTRLIAPLRDRKNRYFRCPKCGQSIRVPRGKGRIRVRCPKCGEQFEKTT